MRKELPGGLFFLVFFLLNAIFIPLTFQGAF